MGPHPSPYLGGHSILPIININTNDVTNSTAKWKIVRKSLLGLKNWDLGSLNSGVYLQDLEGLW